MSTTVISTSGPGKTPVWAETMRRWTDYFVKDFGGGPRPWKFAWVINFQKTGTFPMLAFLIAWYHNTTTAAWIYLAMHGTYGLVWIIKDVAFPDRTGEILEFAKRAKGAGVDVALHSVSEGQHNFILGAGRVPEVDEAIENMGQWLRSRLWSAKGRSA